MCADAVVVPLNEAACGASAAKETPEETAYEAGAGNGSRSVIRASVRACMPVEQQSRAWDFIEGPEEDATDPSGFDAGLGQHAC